MAELALSDRAGFTNAVTGSIIAAHPYVLGTLEALQPGEIVFPFVRERDLVRAR